MLLPTVKQKNFDLVCVYFLHHESKLSSPDMKAWDRWKHIRLYFQGSFLQLLTEKWVSKEFGLSAHDEELRCFLQSRKLVGRFYFLSTDEDCSEFLWDSDEGDMSWVVCLFWENKRFFSCFLLELISSLCWWENLKKTWSQFQLNFVQLRCELEGDMRVGFHLRPISLSQKKCCPVPVPDHRNK